jgi:hypothetical protein
MESSPRSAQTKVLINRELIGCLLALQGIGSSPTFATTLSFDLQGGPAPRYLSQVSESGYVLWRDAETAQEMCVLGAELENNPDPAGASIWLSNPQALTTLGRADGMPFDFDTIDLKVNGPGTTVFEFEFVYEDGGAVIDWVELTASNRLQTIGINRRGLMRASWRQTQGSEQGLSIDNVQVQDTFYSAR